VRKSVLCALALCGAVASAQAADLSVDSLKDPLPDQLSYKGVTLYGTIDVGGFYATHAMPNSGANYANNQTIFSDKYGSKNLFSLGNNALSQSTIGIKVEEGIGYGFAAIARIETGFNPLSGEIADACASVVRASGQLPGNMEYNGDGSRCGQAFNGEAYAGLSNSSYGTVKVGRNNSLQTDAVLAYDPLAGSYAFSGLGVTASDYMGGTELARWDNSIKYAYQYGPVHLGLMYANGGADTDIQDHAGSANIGATWRGLSVDGTYTKMYGATAITADNLTQISSNAVPVTVTNNEVWSVLGKYSFDAPALFGAGGYKDCGFKDDCAPAKFTLSGGFFHVALTNPDRPASEYSYGSTIGGYGIAPITTALSLGSERDLETFFVGGKYETGPWTASVAYYQEHQFAYDAIVKTYSDTAGVAAAAHGISGATGVSVSCTGTINGSTTTIAQSNANLKTATPSSGTFATGQKLFYGNNTQAANCAGDIRMVSGVIDYTFNKHFDVYAGVSFSDIGGGLASGFLKDNNTSVTTGMRLKF